MCPAGSMFFANQSGKETKGNEKKSNSPELEDRSQIYDPGHFCTVDRASLGFVHQETKYRHGDARLTRFLFFARKCNAQTVEAKKDQDKKQNKIKQNKTRTEIKQYKAFINDRPQSNAQSRYASLYAEQRKGIFERF